MIPAQAFLAYVDRNRRRLLLGILVLLHLILLQGLATDVGSAIGKMLLVGHIGLFLLWQPVVHGEQRLSPRQLALTFVIIAGTVFWLNWWLVMVWVMLLAAIIGGKVFFFGARWTRVFHLMALAYLVTALLVMVTPQVIPKPVAYADELKMAASYGLPLLLAVMALLPVERESTAAAEVIDFVYSMFLFLLLAVLVLGSLAFMLLMHQGYLESLVYTLLAMSAVLLVLGWVWNPRVGFAGFGVLFTRYVLSVGLPFEQWLHRLAECSVREELPEDFLRQAVAPLADLPWVEGGEWAAAGRHGRFGACVGRRSEFAQPHLHIVLYTRLPLSPALTWHFNLLARLLGEFYVAKLRAAKLQQMSYVQAIHETGARLTHDVKNLLQSLNTLCFAAGREGDEISPQFQALLRRQLPVIVQRLQQTLDKLRKPGAEGAQEAAAGEWWEELQRRYADAGVEFEAPELDRDIPIPLPLFNSVAENLLQNALHKRHHAPALRIIVSLRTVHPLRLAVCDDGAPMPETIAASLFAMPVESASGLGIGLYQAARHAEVYEYALNLASNEAGRVCVELVRQAGAKVAAIA